MKYGGDTSCVMVETENAVILLDAGTGITKAPACALKNATLLITHPHADHLLGLPFFPYLMNKEMSVDICSTVKNGLDTLTQISRLMSPPLWPITINDFPADVKVSDISFPYTVGDVTVTGIKTGHPGGSIAYRLDCGKVSLVYATDYEHSEKGDKELIRLASGADLLLYDGQYTEEEYRDRKGFGHSTPGHGVSVFRECGAGELRIIHHDPHHSDDMLEKMESEIKTENIAFGRQGETIWLRK